MKIPAMKILATSALALCALGGMTMEASAQHRGGGGFHGGGGSHGGGFHGGGFRGGYHGGFRGGFHGGYGYRGRGYYGYGPGLYLYGDPFWGAPYYPSASYDDDYDVPPPPPPEPAYTEHQERRYMTRRPRETDYELPDSVLFAFDSSKVSDNAGQIISQIADEAKRQGDSDVVVEGYTDTSGSKPYNEALSKARSRAVAQVLEQNGVAVGRIKSVGFGETHLAVQTGDEVKEAKNRRVMIRIMNAEGRQDAHQVDNNGQPYATRTTRSRDRDASPPGEDDNGR